MKKLLILSALLLTHALQHVQAQEELAPGKREKLNALKVAYLTNELDLTPEEAQQFWPVYNEMTEKLDQIRKQRKEYHRQVVPKLDELTDEQIAVSIDRELAFEQQELDIKKAYNSHFKSILPIKKVAKLHVAEQNFRKELLRRAKERNRAPGPGPH